MGPADSLHVCTRMKMMAGKETLPLSWEGWLWGRQGGGEVSVSSWCPTRTPRSEGGGMECHTFRVGKGGTPVGDGRNNTTMCSWFCQLGGTATLFCSRRAIPLEERTPGSRRQHEIRRGATGFVVPQRVARLATTSRSWTGWLCAQMPHRCNDALASRAHQPVKANGTQIRIDPIPRPSPI